MHCLNVRMDAVICSETEIQQEAIRPVPAASLHRAAFAVNHRGRGSQRQSEGRTAGVDCDRARDYVVGESVNERVQHSDRPRVCAKDVTPRRPVESHQQSPRPHLESDGVGVLSRVARSVD